MLKPVRATSWYCIILQWSRSSPLCFRCSASKSSWQFLASTGLNLRFPARAISMLTKFSLHLGSISGWCVRLSMHIIRWPSPGCTSKQKRFLAATHSLKKNLLSRKSSLAIWRRSSSAILQSSESFMIFFRRQLCTSPWPWFFGTCEQNSTMSQAQRSFASGLLSMSPKRCTCLSRSASLQASVRIWSRFAIRQLMVEPSLPKPGIADMEAWRGQSRIASLLQCCFSCGFRLNS
mmetsp:Transcript_129278/g.402085  ORF Transcript_129278/g.402085 Transcript_129278/m.402085 type:complete len:234 (+) Transcript_129278:1222-1923(+)